MEGTANSKQLAEEIAHVLQEHKGQDTVLLDISEQSSFADFFIISTFASQGHLKGLLKHLLVLLSERGIEPRQKQKNLEEDGWVLLDCSDIIIHLMSAEMRDFYELERLWFAAKTVFHSSKSS